MELDAIIYLGDYTEKKDAIEEVFKKMNLNYQFLSSDDLQHTIGYLFNLESSSTATSSMNELIGEDLIVFREIEDESIIEISKQLNERNSNVPRKAMLTKHNVNWSLYDLLLEIKEEHKYFNVRGELIERIQEIMKSDPSTVSSETQLSVLEAYDAVQQETPVETLEELLSKLK